MLLVVVGPHSLAAGRADPFPLHHLLPLALLTHLFSIVFRVASEKTQKWQNIVGQIIYHHVTLGNSVKQCLYALRIVVLNTCNWHVALALWAVD